jgi:hypothetical protein
MEGIKDKAGRYRQLAKDETFQEVLAVAQQRQIDKFLAMDTSPDALVGARSVVIALQEIHAVIQSVLDEEAVFDKQNQ